MESIAPRRTPAQLRELISLATRRKFELDKQAVMLGITVDPKVRLEREDLEKEIEIYEDELRRLKRRPKLRPLKQRLEVTKESDEMTASAPAIVPPAQLREQVADHEERLRSVEVGQAESRSQYSAELAAIRLGLYVLGILFGIYALISLGLLGVLLVRSF